MDRNDPCYVLSCMLANQLQYSQASPTIKPSSWGYDTLLTDCGSIGTGHRIIDNQKWVGLILNPMSKLDWVLHSTPRLTFACLLSDSLSLYCRDAMAIVQTRAEILISNLAYRSLYNNLKLSYYFSAKTCFALAGDNMMLWYLSFYYSTFSPLWCLILSGIAIIRPAVRIFLIPSGER